MHKQRYPPLVEDHASTFQSLTNSTSYELLQCISPGKERYYPLLIIGGESRTAKPRFQLDGVIDDFAIYNKALDSAPATAVDKSSADAFVPLTIPAKSTSCKFNVLDVDVQGGVVFTQADKVFRDNAARASIEVSGENMVITFDCPVSAKPRSASLSASAL